MMNDKSFLRLVNETDNYNNNNDMEDINSNSNNIVLVNTTTLTFQTVPPNYLQQVLYKVQALNLPMLPIDTCYIGKLT